MATALYLMNSCKSNIDLCQTVLDIYVAPYLWRKAFSPFLSCCSSSVCFFEAACEMWDKLWSHLEEWAQMFVLLGCPHTGGSQRLRVTGWWLKIYSVYEGKGQIPISCPCIRVWWGEHMRVKIACLCSPACMVQTSRRCQKVILELLEAVDLIELYCCNAYRNRG